MGDENWVHTLMISHPCHNFPQWRRRCVCAEVCMSVEKTVSIVYKTIGIKCVNKKYILNNISLLCPLALFYTLPPSMLWIHTEFIDI